MPKVTRNSKSKDSRKRSSTRSQEVNSRTLRSHNGKPEPASSKKKQKSKHGKRDNSVEKKKPKKKKMVCSACKKEFSYELAFKRHVKTKLCGKKKTADNEEKKPRGRPPKTKSVKKDKSPEDIRSISSSPALEYEGPVRCSVCRNTYRSKDALEKHTSTCVPYSSSSDLDSDDDEGTDGGRSDERDPKRRPEYEEDVIVSDEDDGSDKDVQEEKYVANGHRSLEEDSDFSASSGSTSSEPKTSSGEEDSAHSGSGSGKDSRDEWSRAQKLNEKIKVSVGAADVANGKSNSPSEIGSDAGERTLQKTSNENSTTTKGEGLGGRISEAVIKNSICQVQVSSENAVVRHIEAIPSPFPSSEPGGAEPAAATAKCIVSPSSNEYRVKAPAGLKSPSFSISSLGLDKEDSDKPNEASSSAFVGSLVASVEKFFSTPSTNTIAPTDKSQAISVADTAVSVNVSSYSKSKLPLISSSAQTLVEDALASSKPAEVSPSKEMTAKSNPVLSHHSSNSASPLPAKPQVNPGALNEHLLASRGLPYHVLSRPGPSYAEPFQAYSNPHPNLSNGYHQPALASGTLVGNSPCETITLQDASGQVVRIQMPVVPSVTSPRTSYPLYNNQPVDWQLQQLQQHLQQQQLQQQQQIQHQQQLQQQQQIQHQQQLQQQQQIQHHQHLQQQQQLQHQQLAQQQFIQQQQYHNHLGIQQYQQRMQMQAHYQFMHHTASPQIGQGQSHHPHNVIQSQNRASQWPNSSAIPVHSPLPLPSVNPNVQQAPERNDSLVFLQHRNEMQQQNAPHSLFSSGNIHPAVTPSSGHEFASSFPSPQPSFFPSEKHEASPEKPPVAAKAPSQSCPCDVCLRRASLGAGSQVALNGTGVQQCRTSLPASGAKRKIEEPRVETPRKLKKILPAPLVQIAGTCADSPKSREQTVQQALSSSGNVAVVRPLENPLQKLSDQISQLSKTLEHAVRKPSPDTVRADINHKSRKVGKGLMNGITTKLQTAGKEAVKRQSRKKPLKSDQPADPSKAKSIKVTLKRKEGGDSYAIKDVCETGEDGGGTMRSLKIKAKITNGDQAGTATEVVVVPIVHVVPIPFGEEGDRTIAEEENENVPEKPTSPAVVATCMDDLIIDKSTGTPKTMTHRTVIVYEVKCNAKVLFRSSDVRTIWGHVFELVQGTRMNKSLPPLSYPSTDIALPGNKPSPSDLGFNTLGLVHRAVQFLLQQLPEPQKEEKPKSKTRKKLSNYLEDSRPESPAAECVTGCARTEGFKDRKPFDMFGWLASKHRSLPTIERTNEFTKSELPISLAHMRYNTLREKSPRLLGVFYSTIHGRGLFTRRDIQEGEMVIEYVGEVIRSVLEDYREKLYESKGYGCYMFRIDEYEVVDATMRGNAARFINHSCEPNCKSKVVHIQGKPRILIFALRKILGGEELTYDYNFPKEKKDKKLPCTCGSKRCRRFLN